MAWIRARAAAAEHEGRGWRNAFDGLRPHTQALWAHLPDIERRRFLRHARPLWDLHRHRIAPQASRRLAEAQARGQFRVLAGRVEGFDPHPDGSVDVKVQLRGRHGQRDARSRRGLRVSGSCGGRDTERKSPPPRPPGSGHGASRRARAWARGLGALRTDRRSGPRVGAHLRDGTRHVRNLLGDRRDSRHPKAGPEPRDNAPSARRSHGNGSARRHDPTSNVMLSRTQSVVSKHAPLSTEARGHAPAAACTSNLRVRLGPAGRLSMRMVGEEAAAGLTRSMPERRRSEPCGRGSSA